jgi:plasmid maintenance system antidote protein VapI
MPLALALVGCNLGALLTPPAPGAPATAVTPLGNTVVDEQSIQFAYNALDVATKAAHALVVTKTVVPGSPVALKLSDALDTTRKWLNLADDARRTGNATNAAAAFKQAQSSMGDLAAALGTTR